MRKKASIDLSVGFIVTLIICIVVFTSGVYILKKFFTHAESIKMTYDERTEKEIERLLDDGSKIAIPFDRKTINNGESATFGIGILNVLNTGQSNVFNIRIYFSKAYDKTNNLICNDPFSGCIPNTWLQTAEGSADPGPNSPGINIQKTINNNEQAKFLLGVSPKKAPSGIYTFDVLVCYDTLDCNAYIGNPYMYDTVHKLYVEIP